MITLSQIALKFLTILTDRRFWIALAPYIAVVSRLPEEEITPYVEAVYLLVSSIALNLSWAERPPSGLDFKSEGEKLLQKLRELGLKV